MALIVRLMDPSPPCPLNSPTSVSSASPNVFVEGMPAARHGDSIIPHPLGCGGGTIISSASKTFVNGRLIALNGDSTTCGGSVVSGASKTFAG